MRGHCCKVIHTIVNDTAKQGAAIVLASASPRRRELLAQIGVPYIVVPADIDETRRDDEPPADYVQRMAIEKSRTGFERAAGQGFIALGADTVVVVDEQVLGKPTDREQALDSLRLLSGRTHQVMTAVAVTDGNRLESLLSITNVTMRRIDPTDAAVYWESGEPVDKAGAYAVQGLGGIFIERLEGSYSGVVGLPVHETAELLGRFGYSVL